MRRWTILVLILMAMSLRGMALAQTPPPDLAIGLAGSDATGQPLDLVCALTFSASPANTFVGRCQVTVGGDRLLVDGLAGEGNRLLSVVLNGSVAFQGVAVEGTGRFGPLVGRGAVGFPVLVQIDPFGRAWSITSAVPGGGTQAIAQGFLGKGTLSFTLP